MSPFRVWKKRAIVATCLTIELRQNRGKSDRLGFFLQRNFHGARRRLILHYSGSRDIPPPGSKLNFGAISSWALTQFYRILLSERLGTSRKHLSNEQLPVLRFALDLRAVSVIPLTQQRAIVILDTLSHDSFAKLAASNMSGS